MKKAFFVDETNKPSPFEDELSFDRLNEFIHYTLLTQGHRWGFRAYDLITMFGYSALVYVEDRSSHVLEQKYA